ncbi:COP9 signalosome complex subunit 7-like [Pistacia vera]|uniref:COP9 signalosome complex subunit 7-like n=1 Tax=Pistacia vera TaxID=55513 RepID=UPI001263AE7E|nr:COP9 signalosome complex subunit 7-like [Pistacia vera]
MEIEQKQPQLIEQFVKQASILTLSSLPNLIVEATSHPSLFAFSEILAVPNLLQLEGTENSTYFELLRLFVHGNAARLPQLVPVQVVKLKQLSVLTLAETNKGIVKGKLDHSRRSLRLNPSPWCNLRQGGI